MRRMVAEKKISSRKSPKLIHPSDGLGAVRWSFDIRNKQAKAMND